MPIRLTESYLRKVIREELKEMMQQGSSEEAEIFDYLDNKYEDYPVKQGAIIRIKNKEPGFEEAHNQIMQTINTYRNEYDYLLEKSKNYNPEKLNQMNQALYKIINDSAKVILSQMKK
jgi:predicted nuclease with TOPRIM domain